MASWPIPTHREWIVIRKLLSKNTVSSLSTAEWTALAAEAGITDGDTERIVRRTFDTFKAKLNKIDASSTSSSKPTKSPAKKVKSTAQRSKRTSSFKSVNGTGSGSNSDAESGTPTKKRRTNVKMEQIDVIKEEPDAAEGGSGHDDYASD